MKKYGHIYYIGDRDKYLLLVDKYCQNYLINPITHLDKNLICPGSSKIFNFDYKTYPIYINDSLIITEENWNCPDFIQQEINRIFFPGKIRTNHIVVENKYTLDRIFNIETIGQNDRATNRFELMEID